ncbi:hypothetical protein Asal01_02019 [Fodinibius salicampi]
MILVWRRFVIFLFLCFRSLSVLGQDIDWVSLQEAQTKASEEDKKVLIFAEAE